MKNILFTIACLFIFFSCAYAEFQLPADTPPVSTTYVGQPATAPSPITNYSDGNVAVTSVKTPEGTSVNVYYYGRPAAPRPTATAARPHKVPHRAHSPATNAPAAVKGKKAAAAQSSGSGVSKEEFNTFKDEVRGEFAIMKGFMGTFSNFMNAMLSFRDETRRNFATTYNNEIVTKRFADEAKKSAESASTLGGFAIAFSAICLLLIILIFVALFNHIRRAIRIWRKNKKRGKPEEKPADEATLPTTQATT